MTNAKPSEKWLLRPFIHLHPNNIVMMTSRTPQCQTPHTLLQQIRHIHTTRTIIHSTRHRHVGSSRCLVRGGKTRRTRTHTWIHIHHSHYCLSFKYFPNFIDIPIPHLQRRNRIGRREGRTRKRIPKHISQFFQ